ncbi:homoserine kinase [Arthrobacter roseus]|uniref:homoserine kinase n=1 Tax=Arthrobacter roseus TaxID=136274 RepID=UPI00196374ED|nr:homoserine kinase [Arthrobacter roseus]MBM7849028.1 homoserine kinase [Arthrobacter roseus]
MRLPYRVEPGQDVSVTVPATSANLGPGYDALGLALNLYDVLRVSTSAEGHTTVVVQGEGQNDLPRDSTHLCVEVMSTFFETIGFATPALRLTAENRIPHGRGLGSSAAAVVSAAVAANALLPESARLSNEALLQFCAGVEGHPDNVAPAILGSLAISWPHQASFAAARVSIHPDICVVVAIPPGQLSTASARGLLPDVVPHGAAAANAGRAALLVHALVTDPGLLVPATEDFLHQSYRAEVMPDSSALVKRLRSAGFAAVISGAGPTVAVILRDSLEANRVEAEIHAGISDGVPPEFWRVLRLKVDLEGARVEVHRR